MARTYGARDRQKRNSRLKDIHKYDNDTWVYSCPSCRYEVRTGNLSSATKEKVLHTNNNH